MIKVFISHSSKQKSSFVIPIMEKVGRNQCFVDAYDFQPAFRTMDEIIEKLNKSSIFVFLATKDSLSSEWCKKEIFKAKKLYEQRKIRYFLAYIIDKNVTISDLPDWISRDECFNLKYFRSPYLISKDIENKLRKLNWEQDCHLKAVETVYVGRNREIEDFQFKMSSKPYTVALVVSGRPGSGREEFASHCLRSCKLPEYDKPEKLSLERDQSIENLITQLNSITYLYSDEYIRDVLTANEDTKIDSLVEQLNEIYSYGHICINDTRSIIRDGGQIVDWFGKLLGHININQDLKMAIASSVRPRAYYEDKYSRLVTVTLEELSVRDRQIILTEYIKQYGGTPLTPGDIKHFLSRALYSPAQIKNIAKIIAIDGVREAKYCMEAIEKTGRDLIAKILSEYKDRSEVIQFLILMSKLESTSYDALEKIYGEEYVSVESFIPELIDSAIIIVYGPSDSFLRIDSAVGDYLLRTELSLQKSLRKKLDEYTRSLLSDEYPSITEDLTTYMTTIREAYKRGIMKVEDILLPSEALRTIIKLYNEDDNESYQNVEKLCKDLLEKGHLINLDKDFQNNVRYWLCLTLAHLGKEQDFFKYVREFDSMQADFLKGFWFRQQKQYKKAREFYQKVLDSPYSRSKRKTNTEMVIVLTQLKDYENAFKLAKELFKEDPSNAYYTSVLFKASVKKTNNHEEKDLQEKLIANMRSLLVRNQEQYVAAMELYLKVKDITILREKKYAEIEVLRNRYKSCMIPYLSEAIEDCISYLCK